MIGGATASLFLKSNMNLVGTASKSQAARLITMRLREELGGTTPAQWKAARNVAFKTTVLALNTEPGQVDQLDHAEMPGGSGKFRVQGWKLNADYSIEIHGRTVVDEMYDVAAAGATAADAPLASSTLDSTTNGDFAVPAAPTFTLAAPGDGTLKLTAPTWADSINTLSIKSARWTIRYYDTSSTQTTLAADITDAAASMTVASALGLSVGDLLSVGRECVKVTSIVGTTIGILRAQCGSVAAAHSTGAHIWKLTALITDETMDLTNTADWSASLSLYDAFIASADCHGVNSYGAGADATNNYLDAGSTVTPGMPLGDPFGQLYLINGG